MKVLISGATGSNGAALIPALEADGHRVTRLTRQPRSQDDIYWDPSADEIDTARLGGHDAVVHLAGETLTEVPWPEEQASPTRTARRASNTGSTLRTARQPEAPTARPSDLPHTPSRPPKVRVGEAHERARVWHGSYRRVGFGRYYARLRRRRRSR